MAAQEVTEEVAKPGRGLDEAGCSGGGRFEEAAPDVGHGDRRYRAIGLEQLEAVARLVPGELGEELVIVRVTMAVPRRSGRGGDRRRMRTSPGRQGMFPRRPARKNTATAPKFLS